VKKDLERLLDITEGCRPDMHEPDEQELTARVVGWKFDNASGEDINVQAIDQGWQELVVILKRYVDGDVKIAHFNLATLIALARYSTKVLLHE
jgi:hypothetical protein